MLDVRRSMFIFSSGDRGSLRATLGLAAGTCQGCKGSRAKGNGPGQAKAEKDAAVAGRVVAADRRPAAARIVAPAAAADYAVRASGFVYPSTSIIRGLLVIIVPVIRHPLPDIAVHVIKPEAIGLFFANRMELIFGILFTFSALQKGCRWNWMPRPS